MTRDRTTSATPVSHVFPGRRGEAKRPLTFDDILLMDAIRRENHCTDTVCAYRHQCFCWGEFVATPRQAAPRMLHAPSTPQTAPNRPDCVCAAYGALEARQGIVDGLVRFAGDLVAYLGKLEARLQALEVSGEGERG